MRIANNCDTGKSAYVWGGPKECADCKSLTRVGMQAVSQFSKKYGVPDMVVLSSTLWDLARLHDRTNHTVSGMLAPEVLKEWIDSVHAIMDLVKVPPPPSAAPPAPLGQLTMTDELRHELSDQLN